MQNRGRLFRSLHEDCSKIFTNPLRSLMSWGNHHHERHSEQPSRCLETIIKTRPQKGGRLSCIQFQTSCQSHHLQQSHIYHPAAARVTVGDQRQSGHCQCGVGCRQPRCFQQAFFFDWRLAFIVVRRFQGPHLRIEDDMDNRRGHRCGRSLKGDRAKQSAEHSEMNNTQTCSEQDPDEYLHIMDSCCDRLNACDLPKGPTDRQCDDIYCTLCRPDARSFAKPKGLRICLYPAYAGGH